MELKEETLGHNQPEFTVSEISYALKSTVEQIFGSVRVRGEISGFKRHTSGHLYFSLKDDNAVINAVIWRGSSKLSFNPEDGIEVICSGRLSTYPGRSQYQMIVEKMEPAGAGALMMMLEKLKEKLRSEGLFDEARKKSLPRFPSCIGVITSPTGAVIRDIMHRIRERYPLHVILWPVAVQGEGAKEQVAEAINGFNNLPENINKPDVIIVARGGGSIEDLWAFSEEIVVRAAANSKIPLISAVGHETDFTLIDFVSDKRAPTPTAAAEMAVPVRIDIISGLLEYENRMFSGIKRLLKENSQKIKAASAGLISPKQILENFSQRLDDFSERLLLSIPSLLQRKMENLKLASLGLRSQHLLKEIENDLRNINNIFERGTKSISHILERKSASLLGISKLLESYHYENTLARGFALVRDVSGKLLTSAGSIMPGDSLTLQFKDGKKKVTADGGTKKSAKRTEPGNQGSLF